MVLTRTKKRSDLFPYLLLVPTLLSLLLLRYYPAFSAFYHSFFQWDGFAGARYTGLRNYRELFQDRIFLESLVNVGKFLGGRVILNLVFPLFGAELLFHLKNKLWAYVYRILFIVPMVVPSMVVLMVWKFIYDPYQGLLNSMLDVFGLSHLSRAWLGDFSTSLYAVMGLGFPWITGIGISGFAMLIYLSGLQNIPESLFDAGQVDGITVWQRFFYLELPLIASQIKLILILTVINTLQAYVPIMVMTGGGPGSSSMVPGLYLYQNAFYYDRFGYASAIGVVMAIALIVVTYINHKYIRSVQEVGSE